MAETFLHENIKMNFGAKKLRRLSLPQCIQDNLKHELREYQIHAFQNLLAYYEEDCEDLQTKPNHLLFQMATGSGKTMIMAGLILYYYSLGYRNFLFFVNRTNIIAKTKDNFLNKYGSKYLFKEHIFIDDKEVFIKQVDNFESSDQDNINILFKTTSGLLSDLEQNIKENSVSYEDLKQHKIVLISDEAHHINAETTNKHTKEERLNIHSWEGVVQKIFESNYDNVLLEFTATANLNHPAIKEKYLNKLIYNYDLKQFREDGFSKNIYTLAVDTDNYFTIALQGVILSQYRKKIFEKYRQNIKPVILIKSKTIDESKTFQKEFNEKLHNITANDIEKIKHSANKGRDNILNAVFDYLDKENIDYHNFIEELKEDFSEDKQISVNNRADDEQKQMYLNTLEDKQNPYRLIFAVDKLNEGWDVLNLFDIVRYKATNTTQDAQLIGRGARYCPFVLQDDQDRYKRKYDNQDNELRICESMYYHATNDSRLIAELNSVLIKNGLLPPKPRIKQTIKLKDNFIKTELYNSGYIYLNNRVKHKAEHFFEFENSIKTSKYEYKYSTNQNRSIELMRTGGVVGANIIDNSKSDTITFSCIGQTIIRKALNNNPFFEFCNLRTYYPNLKSITEFIESKNFLADIQIDFIGKSKEELTVWNKYDMVLNVLNQVQDNIKNNHFEFYGTTEFQPIAIKNSIDISKDLYFSPNDSDTNEYGKSMKESNNIPMDLSAKDKQWYAQNDCYGTSEEKHLIHYIAGRIDKLKAKYSEVYLLRNEQYKDIAIYDFEQGRKFEPDFILFLKDNKNTHPIMYQLFIEPKGKHLEDKDKWKNDFLKQIKDKYKINTIFNNKQYNIIGLPFYNYAGDREFAQEFENFLQ